jgi:hypothetical protein
MVGDTMALLLFMETPRYIISSDLSIQYLALFTKIQYLALFFFIRYQYISWHILPIYVWSLGRGIDYKQKEFLNKNWCELFYYSFPYFPCHMCIVNNLVVMLNTTTYHEQPPKVSNHGKFNLNEGIKGNAFMFLTITSMRSEV